MDGDIIRYELGYAAEAGWKAKTNSDRLPPFDYVREQLDARLARICAECRTSVPPRIFMTRGKTFRYDLAKKKPYKGLRPEKKPFHFKNLTVHLRDVLGAREVTYLEADDMLALDHVASQGQTILVSRDKDLRQVPGWFYSWELGKQAAFGPHLVTKEGWLKLDKTGKQPKLTGTGLSWFYAQVLMGDPTDNVPGCPGWGPVAAYEALADKSSEEQLATIIEAYALAYGYTDQVAPLELLEQGKLLWLVRRLDQNGMPITWELGMTE